MSDISVWTMIVTCSVETGLLIIKQVLKGSNLTILHSEQCCPLIIQIFSDSEDGIQAKVQESSQVKYQATESIPHMEIKQVSFPK